MHAILARLKRFSSGSHLRQNISLTLGRQLMAAFAQFLLVVVIARELGPEGNGFYAMAILIPAMLANLLNFGVGPATVYYLSRGDFNVHQAMSGNLSLALIAATVGIAIALPLLVIWGGELFPGVPQGLLFLGLASFPLTLLLSYLNTILQGVEDFKSFNLTVVLPPFVNLVGVMVALYGFELGVEAAMVAYISGQLVGLLIVFSMLSRSKLIREEEEEEQGTCLSVYARKTLSYGWKAHLSNVMAFVNYRADIFLVNFFLTPASTGLYVIAVQVAEKLWMLSQAASTVLLPRLSAMHQNPKARLALTNRGFVIVSMITTLASIGVSIALYWLISPVFGEEYLQALPAFFWLLPGIIAGAGARIYANCIAAAGKPEWNMYVSVGVVTINIIGNILLVPKYGIVGAAWATSLAYVLNAVVKFWLVRKTISN
jgi:O-antigen/teichoic acid export membrane protein